MRGFGKTRCNEVKLEKLRFNRGRLGRHVVSGNTTNTFELYKWLYKCKDIYDSAG